jgi:thiol-disulfide isomerase/thioredoxin
MTAEIRLTMQRFWLYAVIAILAGLAGFYFQRNGFEQRIAAANSPRETPHTPPSDLLPEFSLKNRDGELQSIHSWPGKSLIINFWATWCAPCQHEIPLLMRINAARAVQGFQVVGVAVDVREAVLQYADQMHIHYPLLIGEQDGFNAINAFGIASVGFPLTVFTDNQERIVALHLGELDENTINVTLHAVERVNRGELTPLQARSAIAQSLGKQ